MMSSPSASTYRPWVDDPNTVLKPASISSTLPWAKNTHRDSFIGETRPTCGNETGPWCVPSETFRERSKSRRRCSTVSLTSLTLYVSNRPRRSSLQISESMVRLWLGGGSLNLVLVACSPWEWE